MSVVPRLFQQIKNTNRIPEKMNFLPRFRGRQQLSIFFMKRKIFVYGWVGWGEFRFEKYR